MINFICVEGNIGSGKSSLAEKLATHFNATLISEEFEENPFLPLFYNDPATFAFPLEFSFLLDRARQLEKIRNEMKGKVYVADYYIAKSLWFARQNLSPSQFEQFNRSYPFIEQITPKPDLLIFLHLPTELIMENIRKRGRAFEKKIDPKYLEEMNAVYKERSAHTKPAKRVLNFNMESNTSDAYEKVFKTIISFTNDATKEDTSMEIRIEA